MPLLGTRGAASARGFGFGAAKPIPAIGSAYEGGYFAGQISTAGNGVADYNLVVSPQSSGDGYYQWKTTDTATTGTSSVINGPTNSANMNNASHPAAQFCEGLTIGGYSDWYMPAKNELEVCYYNLKPTTDSNNTSSGVNPNAVPSRGSYYTTGTPAQTIATDFQSGGTQAYSYNALYDCSTEYTSDTRFCWAQDFGFASSGSQEITFKTTYRRVRAVRRVAV